MNIKYDPIIPGVVPREQSTIVVSPFDNRPVGAVTTSDITHVDKALDNAHQLFNDRSKWLSVRERIVILKRLILIMTENFESLSLNAATEGGKPLRDSRIEVERAIESVGLCIDGLKESGGTEIPMGINEASSGKIAFTTLSPIGVVVAVSAFNHPLNLIVHQVAPAIAVGCPVIVKPAGATPLSCFSFVDMVHQAGLPEGWCQCLLTENTDTAEKLVTDPRVDFFTFIGSAKIGWMLKSKLSAGTRCALEHGGAAPVILDKDVDFSDTIPKLVRGGFYHAGQVCVSVQRVYAHQSNAIDLAHDIATAADKLVVGDPCSEATDVGPLITSREVDRVDQWVKSAVEQGAKLLCGGNKISTSLYAPTVLLDPPDDCEVSQMEVFGPVVCVYSYSDVDDAIEKANALPFSFQASVFSDKIDFSMKAYRKLNASAVMVNEHTAFRVDWMPFAGLRESGYGIGGVPHTMKDMQIEKMLVLSSNEIA